MRSQFKRKLAILLFLGVVPAGIKRYYNDFNFLFNGTLSSTSMKDQQERKLLDLSDLDLVLSSSDRYRYMKRSGTTFDRLCKT